MPKSLYGLLEEAGARYGERVFLRFKQDDGWSAFSYADLLRRADAVGDFLAREGPHPGERVALMLKNSSLWPEIFFGIVAANVAVPVDTRLKEQEVAHVLRDSGARLAFIGPEYYPLIREIEPHLSELETVVVAGRLSGTPEGRVKWLAYSETVEGDRAPGDARPSRPRPADDEPAVFIYTSGTTGRQKGVVLTHWNLLSNVAACLKTIHVRPDDDFLLVLPLHHAFALTTNLLVPLAAGASVSMVESLRTIPENMRRLQPTVLIAVPLLAEKMLARIQAGIQSHRISRILFRLGLGRVPGRAVRRSLGGRLRMIVVGGAPTDPAVIRAFGRLGIPVIEGYGLTEASPVLTLNPPRRPRPGTVGKPLDGVTIRISEPDAAGAGEVLARGPGIMAGYHNDPEATAAALADGWLHTGDLGRMDRHGYLSIVGRRKSLIVNREGKNIHPEEVERAVCRSPLILEALAHGYRPADETTGERVGLIVVPDQEALDSYAAEKGLTLGEEEIRRLLQEEVKRWTADIADYKRPRRVQIRFEEFEKTTTGKIKRYLYS